MTWRLQTADRERIIDEAPDELGRFGLDEPELTVTLRLADGESRSIAFGGDTPVGSNVFVRTGDAETVYTTASSLKDAADKTLYDLRDRSIMSFTDEDVARVEIERPNAGITVERQPDLGDGIDRWALSAPLDARADADEVSSLLRRLRTGNATAFATDEPSEDELAAFGLAEPEITLRVWTAEATAQALQIGGTSDDPSGRYARREGSDAVMIIPDSVVDELPESADALRNRAVVEFARDRVEAIEVAAAAPPVRLEKDGVDWRIRQPRELDGDASTVSALLTAALDLRARAFPSGSADESRFGFATPHARVSFELEAQPGEDAGPGVEAETVTLVLGAATEVEAEEAVDPTAEDTEETETPESVAARYARVDGEPTVFVVEQEDLESIEVDLFALRSKTLVSFAASDLTRLEVVSAGTTLELLRNEDGAWTLAGEALAEDQARAVDDLLWRLNYLDMQGIVAEPGAGVTIDMGDYALREPEARVRAFVDDELVADVAVGGDVPEEELGEDLPAFASRTQTYATLGSDGGVYRIEATLRDAARAVLEVLS